ncbi:hypothetical protein PAECIP112173_01920 [Paenibacillus sp. JJ-100]|nr:hypothetical protein PAECIP112173_01920 [Paenibacillus sp. JJ-100]
MQNYFAEDEKKLDVKRMMALTLQCTVETLHQLIDRDWSKLDQAELKAKRVTVESLSNQLLSEIDHTVNLNHLVEAINYEITHFFSTDSLCNKDVSKIDMVESDQSVLL